MDVVRHLFVPHFILQEFAAGRREGAFPAAGLFIDIKGFSTMTDALMGHGQHGAEVLARMMRRVFTPCIEAVHGQAGFISGFAGDAFTALFPLDHPAGEMPARALAAATAMQAGIAQFSAIETEYGTFGISARIGLALGEVAWSIPTSADGRHASYYFQGSAIDGPALAEHQAEVGEIILDPALYALLHPPVQAEPSGAYYRLVQFTGPAPAPVDRPEFSEVNFADQVFFGPSDLVIRSHPGEFRQVVNLFVSLPTVRTETQLDIFMQSVFELQEQYGGLLNRLDFGDKGANLLLFWGAPRALENDIERALDFILGLQARTSIPIAAGITYQIAMAGMIGSPQRGEYTCYGRGVNLAARFMTAAARGEIWLDEAVARRAERRFELEPRGPQAFKGFARAQKVFVLSERKETSEAFFQGRLVGREAELQRLAEFIQPVFSGQYAGTMVVWGEPGIGKSRLIDSFIQSLISEGQDLQWAICQTDEILRLPLNPFRYWLRGYFGVSAAQAEARNKRSFNRRLDDLIAFSDETLAAELERTRSFLGALLDLSWPDSLYEQLDAKGRYENTFLALIALLKAESRRQPLALLIEDFHWLDDDSRAFLPALVRALQADPGITYPLAILATARVEEGGEDLSRELDGASIVLAGLPLESLAGLAENLLGAPAAPALLRLLAGRAEGNPFFAEQILRYLQEESLLEEKNGQWEVRTDNLTPASLPGDVRAVLVARLDRLSQEVRAVVQTASVLGREFEVRLLAKMLQEVDALPDKVQQAEQAAVWAALSHVRYIFKHAMLRDAAYNMQLQARLQRLHALAVQALETLSEPDPTPFAGELAYHAEQAGLVEKARGYLRLAGDGSKAAYQNRQALQYYSRALALSDPGDLDGRFSLHLVREEIYELLGDPSARLQELESASGLLVGSIDANLPRGRLAELAYRRSKYRLDVGDPVQALQLADEAARLAQEAGTPPLLAKAYLLMGDAFGRQGQYADGRMKTEMALSLGDQLGARDIVHDGLNALGWFADQQGQFSAAREYAERALQLALEMGDRRKQSTTYTKLGNTLNYTGDFRTGWDYYQLSLAIDREIGSRLGEGITLYNLGNTAIMWDGLVEAQSLTEQALVIFREVGFRTGEAYAYVNLGRIHGSSGQLDAALASYEKGVALCRSLGDRHEESIGLLQWAEAARLRGDLAAALELCEQGLAIAREIHNPEKEAEGLAYLGEIYLAMGEAGEAATVLREAIRIRQELDIPYLVVNSMSVLGHALLASGDLPGSLEMINRVIEQQGYGLGKDEEVAPQIVVHCIQVLEAAGDPRADGIIEDAYQYLLSKAEQFTDPAARQAFLENLSYNREIIAHYGARHRGE